MTIVVNSYYEILDMTVINYVILILSCLIATRNTPDDIPMVISTAMR